MTTTTARRITMALALLATGATRFLKRYLVAPHSPQAYLVQQRVADGRRAQRRAFRAGGH